GPDRIGAPAPVGAVPVSAALSGAARAVAVCMESARAGAGEVAGGVDELEADGGGVVADRLPRCVVGPRPPGDRPPGGRRRGAAPGRVGEPRAAAPRRRPAPAARLGGHGGPGESRNAAARLGGAGDRAGPAASVAAAPRA